MASETRLGLYCWVGGAVGAVAFWLLVYLVLQAG